MKKILSLLLVLVFCLSLCACGKKVTKEDLYGSYLWNPSKSEMKTMMDYDRAAFSLGEYSTCVKTIIHTDGTTTSYGGEWTLKEGKTITVFWTDLLAGEDSLYYDGKPIWSPTEQTFKVVNANALTSGAMYWEKTEK